jgi:hypothetical protein
MNRDRVSIAKKGCRKCGSSTVAWHQAASGKWYLIEVFSDEWGDPIGHYRDFHSEYCSHPEKHNQLQASLDAEYAEDRAERERALSAKDAERLERETVMLGSFSALSAELRLRALDDLRKKIERHSENYVSMDYMTDHMRWRAEGEALRYELDLLEDFNSELDD